MPMVREHMATKNIWPYMVQYLKGTYGHSKYMA